MPTSVPADRNVVIGSRITSPVSSARTRSPPTTSTQRPSVRRRADPAAHRLQPDAAHGAVPEGGDDVLGDGVERRRVSAKRGGRGLHGVVGMLVTGCGQALILR